MTLRTTEFVTQLASYVPHMLEVVQFMLDKVVDSLDVFVSFPLFPCTSCSLSNRNSLRSFTSCSLGNSGSVPCYSGFPLYPAFFCLGNGGSVPCCLSLPLV